MEIKRRKASPLSPCAIVISATLKGRLPSASPSNLLDLAIDVFQNDRRRFCSRYLDRLVFGRARPYQSYEVLRAWREALLADDTLGHVGFSISMVETAVENVMAGEIG